MKNSVVGEERIAVLMRGMRAPPLIVSPTQQDEGRRAFQVNDLDVSVDVCAQEQVGCSIKRLTVRPKRPISWDPKRTGQAIAKRVTYLLEPLRLIEAAPQWGTVQVRSSKPWRNNGHVEYFEIVAEDEGAGQVGLSMCRYRATKGRRGRTPIPINLTWEALERLLSDLSTALLAEPQ